MKTRVANESLANLMDRHTMTGAPELCRPEGRRIRCLACGHRCLIDVGLRGICKVRYNEAGQLKVPTGYVAGLQCDPVEKKPFFHVYPSSDALTFGMMGCDLHCSYCFPGDTPVITDRGPITLAEAFQSATRIVNTTDAEIAYPEGLRAVAGSGTPRRIRAVFKHPYQGRLTVLRTHDLPALRCTPDHRIYATDDVSIPPHPVPAGQLTTRHFLATGSSTRRVESGLDSESRATSRANLVPLREVSFVDYAGDVYNMEVEEEHNYLAGNVLVCNCQNYVTSQALRDPVAVAPIRPITPAQLVETAHRERARLVVSSYNEPLITAEWAVSVFREATAAGLACAFVSNGNATPEVLDYLRPWIVAYKIDLKSFSDSSYRSLGGTLENITRTIGMVHERGLWLEVVTLVIPGFNDSDAELRHLARFLASVSRDIPWHVTAFHKDYKMTDPEATSPQTLIRAAEIGAAEGLRFVYAGNLPGKVGPWENTRCPGCQATLIERYGYLVRSYRLTPEGRCPSCQAQVPGIWPGRSAEVRTGNDQAAYLNRLPRPVAAPAPSGGRSLPVLDLIRPPSEQGTPTMTVPSHTPAAPQASSDLTAEHREQIVAAAVTMLRAAVAGQVVAFPAHLTEIRERPVAGAFISLKRGKHLRSCCGLLGQQFPLFAALEHSTVRVVREDVRFPPVSPTELEHLDLEVWLLSNPQRVFGSGEDRLAAIHIGKHGIQVVRGQASGLFLPSVAVEGNWDCRRFLDQVCIKAGLPPTAWKEADTVLSTFEADLLRGMLREASDAATTAERAAPTRRRAGPCRAEELPGYAEFCRNNLTALLTGGIPSYYFFGAADGSVNGVVLTLNQPGAAEQLHFSQLSLRQGLPLQSTLFSLTQAAAQQLAANRIQPAALRTLQAAVTVLHDPVLHGTVGDPHLAGLDTRHRAILVQERNKSALLFDPRRTPEELLTEAASQAHVREPHAAAISSLDAISMVAPVSVTTAPRPVRGPAVRPPAVAGTFYEADPAALAQTVDRLLSGERRPEPWPAAMVPHAGLKYSGQLAANVLQRLEFPKTILAIGPKHTQRGMDWAVAPHQTWTLPTGSVESDFVLARQLCQAIPGLEMDAAAHQGEHGVEVELPLLARLAPESKVVGVAIGHATLEDCLLIAAGLADLLYQRQERPLLLISSDMNHYASDAETRRLDALALAALERLDPTELYETVTRNNISMCGVLPAVIVLETLRLLGSLSRAERVGYATAADVTGDKSRVVGYAGMLIG